MNELDCYQKIFEHWEFINFSFFQQMLIKSCYSQGPVLVTLRDLEWMQHFWSRHNFTVVAYGETMRNQVTAWMCPLMQQLSIHHRQRSSKLYFVKRLTCHARDFRCYARDHVLSLKGFVQGAETRAELQKEMEGQYVAIKPGKKGKYSFP